MVILALPAAGLAGSKSSCAVNLLNLPSTGTFICFDVAVTVLLVVSTWAWANAETATTSDAEQTPASNQRENFVCFMYVLRPPGKPAKPLLKSQTQSSATCAQETGYQQQGINYASFSLNANLTVLIGGTESSVRANRRDRRNDASTPPG